MKLKSDGKTGYRSLRPAALIIIDLCCLFAAYFLYFMLFPYFTANFNTPINILSCNFAIFAVCMLAVRIILGIYSSVWRYATFFVYLKLTFADFVGAVIAVTVTRGFGLHIGIWHNLSIVCISTLAEITLRFVYQYIYQKRIENKQKNFSYVVIVGAGSLGTSLARELTSNRNSEYRPYCFIDTDKRKIGSKILDLNVLDGNSEKTAEIIKKAPVTDIILAFSDKNRRKIEELYKQYAGTGLNIKVYDYPFSDEKGDFGGKRILRDIRIEDLLFRDSVHIDEEFLSEYYSGKTILVTGGGGSIGSELCRQIATKNPKKLIILDIYENNAYELQQELFMKYGSSLDFSVEIASVCDREQLDKIFADRRPDIVFHAAAHKHVPLMESNPEEAIKNNCEGTVNAADMAEKYGVEKFILISTDKAVNPTNVMGATKRICESIVRCRYDSKTSFAAVRFGNVLGSNGSVVPLFKKQISKGGPVTITDKRIIRYFMTISEACQLLLHTGVQAKRGELFVLNMGNPVKILDLAENMIRLSGYTPYEDIDIKEIGLRPGEKLYEELLVNSGTSEVTSHNMIFIEKEKAPTREEVNKNLEFIFEAVKKIPKGNTETFKAALRKIVPTYYDPDDLNK